MNRSIFVFLMSFFIFSTVTAQNGKIKWINTEAEKVTFVGNYQFAKGNDSYYLLMSENGAFQQDLVILKIDTLNFETKRSIELPQKFKKDEIKYHSMQFVNDKLIVFFTRLNIKGKNTFELLKQVYASNLDMEGEMTLITNSPTLSQFYDVGFMQKHDNIETNEGAILKYNQDKTKLMVDKYDLSYSTLKGTTVFKMPNFSEDQTLSDFKFNNAGDLLFLSQPTKQAFNKSLYFTLNKISTDGKVNSEKVAFEHKKYLNEIRYYFTIMKNNVGLFYAFYEENGHAYFLIKKYNLTDLSLIGSNTIDFGIAKEKGLSNGFFDYHKNIYPQLYPQLPTIDELGNIHFVCEFIKLPREVYNSTTKGYDKYSGLGEHILYFVLNADLNKKLFHLIPRYQVLKEAKKKNYSYLYYIKEDRAGFIFYDNDKNSEITKFSHKEKVKKSNDSENGSIYLTTIYLKGIQTKEKLKLTSSGNPEKLNKKGNFNIGNSIGLGNGKFLVGYERNLGLLELDIK